MKYSNVLICSVWFVAFNSTVSGAIPKWLAGLDPSKPASMCAAQERFLSRYPLSAPTQAQGLFELWDFYGLSISANQGSIESVGAGLGADQFSELMAALRTRKRAEIDAMLAKFPNVKQRMGPYIECGYTIVADFDETIRLDSGPYFLRTMQDHIQPALREYVELYLTQNPNWLDYDGGLAIPLDRLRSRIRRWEKFRSENGGILPLTSHLDAALRDMFEIYLCGMDNFSSFDESGRMTEYARDSYEQFLKLNTGSSEYDLVANVIENMKQHDWRLNQELILLYMARGYPAERLKAELDALHR